MEEQTQNPQANTTVYLDQYNPNILQAINRDQNRSAMGIDVQDLPFRGIDVWNGFDFTWLNAKNQAEYAMLTIYVPCDSPNSIESKSLKLYLLSFANSQFQNINEIITTIKQDLSQLTGTPVNVTLANILVDFMFVDAHFSGINIDTQNVTCAEYNLNASLLACDPKQIVTEQLCSDLLKFNSEIGDTAIWGSIRVSYTGPKLDQQALLKYIVSYRNHKGFQEQCVEQIYLDILNHCKPNKLSVEGHYARHGGLDINPTRSNVDFAQHNRRLFRQ